MIIRVTCCACAQWRHALASLPNRDACPFCGCANAWCSDAARRVALGGAAEDRRDATVASTRLAEIREDPARLVTGERLARELAS